MWTQGEVLFEVTEGGHWQDRERAEGVKLCPTLQSSGHSVILQVTFLVVTTISPRVEVKSVSTKEYKRISKNIKEYDKPYFLSSQLLHSEPVGYCNTDQHSISNSYTGI